MVAKLHILYERLVTILLLIYRKTRGMDHRALNRSLINISRQQDIDSIIYQASRCLNEVLDYRFFAFAVYDREYNGGLDIWMDPKTANLSLETFIRQDFETKSTCCNIHYFNKKAASPDQEPTRVDLNRILTFEVMNSQTRAMLYLLPRRTLLGYHSEMLDIVINIMATAISHFVNMKKLENAALIDPLTHCYNRRAMDSYMDRDMSNAARYGLDLSMIMFDIDHFKAVNDSHGHKAGDAVLRSVSKSVQSAIRKGDYLARYGGEEFVLVMPETKFSKAIELAERLRLIIENLKLNFENHTINITASFGITSRKKETDKNKLLKKADEMLYEAKKSGRNRIKPDLRLYAPMTKPSFLTNHEKPHHS